MILSRSFVLGLILGSFAISTTFAQPAPGGGGAKRAGLEEQEPPGPGERGGGPGGPSGPGGPGGGFGMRGGPGGMPPLSPPQQAAIRSIIESTAKLDQALAEARDALNAAVYSSKPDPLDIKAKAEKVAGAELARSLARAEAFAKVQASPDRLDLPPPVLLMILENRGGRSGPGGPGGPGAPGGPGGPGGPGPSRTPPIKGGFEWID